ncbi:hypothetical protein LSH36_1712g00001, partial [Paralvinella palmiformis]
MVALLDPDTQNPDLCNCVCVCQCVCVCVGGGGWS